MVAEKQQGIAIVGSGLVGCLLGVYLRRHKFPVTIFESRPDPRKAADAGRSINLIITSRGIAALTGADEELAKKVMSITVPVYGRVLHGQDGSQTYQPYGPDMSHCNFSVSRWELNTVLIEYAERAGCMFHFSHPLAHVDVKEATLYFYLQDHTKNGLLYQKSVQFDSVFGTDGGGSRCRQALTAALPNSSDVSQPLGYGYKELTMPRSDKMDSDALHIWPRGSHFMMALPNKDKSYTMTLYMHEQGRDLSFAALNTPAKVRAYFETYYPDAVPLMPKYLDEYARNPVGFLGTVFMGPWVYDDKLALVGDAAHAITPFFGQGCNSGFEDVLELNHILTRAGGRNANMRAVFTDYFLSRKVNADAIGNLALDNFTEMMSKTGNRVFLLEKAVEIVLQQKFPDTYASRYSLVTHSLVPYDLCRQIGVIQEGILGRLAKGISRPEDVCLKTAAKEIDTHLVPFLRKHNITKDMFMYTSKYYPAAVPRSKM